MVKKLVAIVLTVALLGALCISPAYAAEESLENAKFFGVDFTTGSAVDTVGELTPRVTWDGEVKYTTDETLGKTVADFDGSYAIGYAVDYSKLESNFTIEAYVQIDPEATSRWGLVCGTIWLTSGKEPVNGVGISYGWYNSVPGVGARKSVYTLTCGHGTSDSYFACGEKGVWSHLVYTHDGSTEAMYLNGVLVESQAATVNAYTHDTSNDHADKFRIGGYNFAGNWDCIMKCAAVNLYEEAATADDVATLYTAMTGNEAPTPSTDPSEEPSDSTEVPTATDEPANNATAAPTQAPAVDNTQTFDLGLVSLAAVALSSAVVVKKKRR